MTYQKGSTILAGDLNAFLATINNVYGVGTADRGYGQTTINQFGISSGTIIRSFHWTNLIAMMNVCANQQGTTMNTPPTGSLLQIGDIIRAYEQAAPTSSTYELANNITLLDTNRLNVSGTSLTVTTDAFSETMATSWTSSITGIVSATWTSENNARYYFNSGGQVRLVGVQPIVTAQDANWNSAFTGMGNLNLAAHSTTNSGSLSGSQNVGYYALTDSYQIIYTATNTGTGSYTSNYNNITIYAKRLNYVGVNSGNGNGVQFQIVLTDSGTYSTAAVTAGTTINFDNVEATTFLTGIQSPTYATVQAF